MMVPRSFLLQKDQNIKRKETYAYGKKPTGVNSKRETTNRTAGKGPLRQLHGGRLLHRLSAAGLCVSYAEQSLLRQLHV